MGYDWSGMTEAEFEAVPDLLFIMRQVASMDARPGAGLMRTYYDFKKKDLDGFLKRWEKLEEAYLYSVKAKEAAASEAVEDVGTEKAVALCEQLIKEELAKIRSGQ